MKFFRIGPNRKSRSDFSSGEIVHNKQTMEYHQATGQLSVSFRNMSLKKIKRAEKKGTESVMDEKFALLFWSEFAIGNEEYACTYQVVFFPYRTHVKYTCTHIIFDTCRYVRLLYPSSSLFTETKSHMRGRPFYGITHLLSGVGLLLLYPIKYLGANWHTP